MLPRFDNRQKHLPARISFFGNPANHFNIKMQIWTFYPTAILTNSGYRLDKMVIYQCQFITP